MIFLVGVFQINLVAIATKIQVVHSCIEVLSTVLF